MKETIRLAWDALFLNEAPYAEVRDRSSPVLWGLKFVVIIALIVALVGLVGAVLEWGATPNLNRIKEIVWEGIQQMPLPYELRTDPELRERFRQQYEWGWRIFPNLFGAPNLITAGARVVFLPVGLLFSWLLYGVVVHLFARLLGGQANLPQTLGSTALAVAPQLLNLVMILPFASVGGVVGIWTLLCRYLAVKTSHRVTWSRALAAAILPYVLLALLVASFACLGGAVFGTIFGGGTAQ